MSVFAPPFWDITLASLVMCGVSFAYYLAAASHTESFRRLLASLHGVTAAAIDLGVWLFWVKNPSADNVDTVLVLLQLLPLTLIATAFVVFRGKSLVHLLQIPNFLAMYYGVGTFLFRLG